MTRTLATLATVACFGAVAFPVHAHHSHPAFYDFCKRVIVEGGVESVQWKDPHTWIDLKVDDGTIYHVEWTSLRGLTNEGVARAAKDALTFGARVVVRGMPIRSGAQIRARFPDLKNDPDPKTVDPVQIRRSDDSWSWTRDPGPPPPSCGGQ